MTRSKIVNIQYVPSIEEGDSTRQLKAGGFLWPSFAHNYPVFALKLAGGKYRYKTGLIVDEAPEDKKDEIRQAIKEIEAQFGEGSTDPFNHEFWKDIVLSITKKNTFLDVTNNNMHKLYYYAIKAGGIHEVAASAEQIDEGGQPRKFFMVEPEELSDLVVQNDRAKNKAISKLEILDEEKTYQDMFLIHKILVNADRGTTHNTPKSLLYRDLSDFINGKLVKTEKKKTVSQFIEAYELFKTDKKKLFVTAYLKDAIYYNFITTSEDNALINSETKTKYGATLDKAVEFLSNPVNQGELDNVKERVEKKWKD